MAGDGHLVKIIVSVMSQDANARLRDMQLMMDGAASRGLGLASSLGGVVTALTGVAGATMAVRESLRLVDDYKKTTVGVAALLTDTLKKPQEELRKAFAQNLAYAEGMYNKLELASRRFFASGGELVEAWEILSTKGVRLVSDEDINNLGVVVDRIKLATKGQTTSLQIAQEMRSLLTGQARMTDQVAQILKQRLGPAWQEQLYLAMEEGRVLEWVAEQFKGMAAASDAIRGTLENQRSSFSSLSRQVLRSGLLPFYEDSAKALKRVNDYLEEHGRLIGAAMREKYDALKRSVQDVWSVAGPVATHPVTLDIGKYLALGSVLAGLAALISRNSLWLTGAFLAAGKWGLLAWVGTQIYELTTKWRESTTAGKEWAATLGTLPETLALVANATWRLAASIIAVAVARTRLVPSVTREGYSAASDLAKGLKNHEEGNYLGLRKIWPRLKLAAGRVKDEVIEPLSTLWNDFEEETNRLMKEAEEKWDSLLKQQEEEARKRAGGKKPPGGPPEVPEPTAEDLATAHTFELQAQMQELERSMQKKSLELGKETYAEKKRLVDLEIADIYRKAGFEKSTEETLARYLEGRFQKLPPWQKAMYDQQLEFAALVEQHRGNRLFEIDQAQAQAAIEQVDQLAEAYERMQAAMAEASEGVLGKLSRQVRREVRELQSSGGLDLKAERRLTEYQAGRLPETSAAERRVFEEQAKFQAMLEAYRKFREEAALGGYLEEQTARMTAAGDELRARFAQFSGKQTVAAAESAATKEWDELRRRLEDRMDVPGLEAAAAKGNERALALLADYRRTLGELAAFPEAAMAVYWRDQARAADELLLAARERLAAVGGGEGRGARLAALRGEVARERARMDREFDVPGLEAAAAGGEEQARQVLATLHEARRMLAEYERSASARMGNDLFAGMRTGFTEWQDRLASGFEYGVKLAQDTAEAMATAFDDFFFDVFTGQLKSAGEYFRGFAQAVLRSITQIMAQQAAAGILGAIGFGTVKAAANGAVWEGGWRPLQAFAGGGLVNRPTLGIVGEGRYPEAVVPLPDGRRIPVDLRNSQPATPAVRIVVNNNLGREADARASEPRWNGQEWVVGVWLDALRTNRMGLRTALGRA